MLLPAGESPPNNLSQRQRAFLLAAIRSALISRHPELRTSEGLGVVESELESIIALAQRTISSAPPADLNNQLDEHVCPHCTFTAPGGTCELRGGAGQGDRPAGCVLRRYGPTIFRAARQALVKLAVT